MKKNILLLLALSVLALQCKEDEPEVVNQLDLLPPATQTGEYTFGCLVNGQAWVPENSYYIVAMYQFNLLQLGAEVENRNTDQGLGIYIRPEEPGAIEERTYDLIPEPIRGATFTDSFNTKTGSVEGDDGGICWYEYEDLLDGTLTITHFDTENFVISGTFEFTTVHEGCDTIRVTDGRFDTHYIP